jgi:hypothetical protein
MREGRLGLTPIPVHDYAKYAEDSLRRQQHHQDSLTQLTLLRGRRRRSRVSADRASLREHAGRVREYQTQQDESANEAHLWPV